MGLPGWHRQNARIPPHRVGGVEDHVHLLLSIPARVAVSDAVQQIKGVSSIWIKDNLSGCLGFGWQDGYGAFTVSKSHLGEVQEYIRGQREHHRVKTFQEEFIAFLKRHEIDYDERYLWGCYATRKRGPRTLFRGLKPHGYSRLNR